jgi:hypothetical protein
VTPGYGDDLLGALFTFVVLIGPIAVGAAWIRAWQIFARRRRRRAIEQWRLQGFGQHVRPLYPLDQDFLRQTQKYRDMHEDVR